MLSAGSSPPRARSQSSTCRWTSRHSRSPSPTGNEEAPMNHVSGYLRASLWWVLPLVLLAAIIGWEVNWGAELRKHPPPEETLTPKPVVADLLPNYTIEGGIAARSETVNRTLFNPTRRPAPVAVVDAAKPRMQRGQFTLTGTTVAGDRSLAFLKEAQGGKARTVRKGDTINGMLVAEVTSDRVKLAMGDDTEELMLRVVTNPKPTPVPAAPAAPGTAQPPATPAAAQPQQPTRQQPAQAQTPGQNTAQTLAERRRAARAAEAAAQAQKDGQQAGGDASTQAAPSADGADPRWQQLDNRYRRRAQGAGK